MKAFVNFILFAAFSVLLFSCQKELSIDLSGNSNGSSGGDNNGNTSIIGDWDFIAADMDVSAVGLADDDLLGTIELINSYKTTTQNNKGSLKITTTEFQSSGLSYSVSTDLHISLSTGGVPAFPDQTVPFAFTVPSSNNSGKYQQIGSDSLYFPETSLISIPETSNGVPSSVGGEPGGARFSLVSDTLKILGSTIAATTLNEYGYNFSVKKKENIVFRYQRK
ncbi:MAG: hypothetical protein J0H29_20500 [Sphingobacteriales bacterium]|nr:hypothetical protein [Sphingobacteriales bacterium]OJY88427.1 MAG: hypothetical protein BGP14_13425 [Sphingobacteriales bacterium 44-15]